MSPETPAPDLIRATVERLVTSPQLAASPSLCRFLRYVVEETLAGREGQIKEYSLGAEVFGRGDSFDPRVDPIVRVQARNLRARMAKYYETTGASEAILIDLPKRTYVPVFTTRFPLAPEPVEVAQEVPDQPGAASLPQPPITDSGAPEQPEAAEGKNRSVTRALVAGVLVALVGGGALLLPHPAGPRVPDAEAQEQYIRGRFLLDRFSEKSLRESVTCFERAIARDPRFAAAHAGIATAYNVLAQYGYVAPPEAMEKARTAARKAIALDPKLADGHVALAAILEAYDWNWTAAEREYRRAIELNPASAEARMWYGMFLRDQGRLDEAIPQLLRAGELAPVSETISLNLAYTLMAKGNPEPALEQALLAAELNPNSVATQLLLSRIYRCLSRKPDADAALRHAEEVAEDNPHGLSALARAYVGLGQNDKGALLMRRLEDLSRQRYVSPYDLGNLSLLLGDESRALELFEEAYRQRSSGLIFLRQCNFDGMRHREKFNALVRRMGLVG